VNWLEQYFSLEQVRRSTRTFGQSLISAAVPALVIRYTVFCLPLFGLRESATQVLRTEYCSRPVILWIRGMISDVFLCMIGRPARCHGTFCYWLLPRTAYIRDCLGVLISWLGVLIACSGVLIGSSVLFVLLRWLRLREFPAFSGFPHTLVVMKEVACC
jgi:hypothetical protein